MAMASKISARLRRLTGTSNAEHIDRWVAAEPLQVSAFGASVLATPSEKSFHLARAWTRLPVVQFR